MQQTSSVTEEITTANIQSATLVANKETQNNEASMSQQIEIPKVNPEDITPQMWYSMFVQLNSTLGTLQTQVTDLNSLKGKVENFSIEWKESVDQSIIDLDDKNDQQDFRVKLLTNMVIRQDERIKTLEDRLTAAYQREIKANLKISGLVEKPGETRETLFEMVKQFLKNEMSITQEIEVRDVFRIGSGVARQVMIKLKYPNDKLTIMSNASDLKGKENEKKRSYFVEEDLTDQQNEARQFYRELKKENTQNNTDLTIKMKRGQVMVNNETVKPQVIPPTCADLLQTSQEELNSIKAIRIVKGGEHTEKGSEFTSYATKVRSKQDVEKAYKKMKIKFADATHIICSYRLDNPVGPYRQQAIDDGDGESGTQGVKEKGADKYMCFHSEILWATAFRKKKVRNSGLSHGKGNSRVSGQTCSQQDTETTVSVINIINAVYILSSRIPR